jgi:alkanesulfonate monooxygenase SsuD/methylene tetrahydromethanopterin reductase-like flavin-dependent oxidoreductase (luciferase family)
MAAVPAELIDACFLIGPAERIKERLQRWTDAAAQGHVSSMLLACQQPEALALVAETVL